MPTHHLHHFWAKTIEPSGEGFPVVTHSLDVALVSHIALNQFVSSSRQNSMSERFGIPIEKVLKFACAVHDSGKISSFFQQKVDHLFQPLSARGFPEVPIGQTSSGNPHSLVGGWALLKWFEESSLPTNRKSKRGWFDIVGGHHGRFASDDDFQRNFGFKSESTIWHDARNEFFDTMVESLKLTRSDLEKLAAIEWQVDDIVLITALVIVSDWLGSNQSYFPHDRCEIDQPEMRSHRAEERIQWGATWSPGDNPMEDFAHRFGLPKGTNLRPVQASFLQMVAEMQEPGLIILENETGGGKTASALMAAELLAHKFDLQGIYFGQPTQVNSNAMFTQVVDWIKSGYKEGRLPTNMVLAHGKSSLNSEYSDLLSETRISKIYDDQDPHAAAEANSWFTNNKRGLLGSIVVGTIDQFLFSALASKHVMLRHLGLADKVVILDEIHASDDYMIMYLCRALFWMGRYGVPVIALSATIPAERRTELAEAYRCGTRNRTKRVLSQIDKSTLENPGLYPRITTVTNLDCQSIKTHTDGTKKVTQISFTDGCPSELAARITEESADGGCIAVICSTVTRAQEFYSAFKEQSLSDDELMLLHSRFMTIHRAQREAELVAKLGRNNDHRPQRLIVVSTQVIEQGLDLDFDLMYTDIAPIDLVIQRVGRLHRHEANNSLRPITMTTPRANIMGVEFADDTAPNFPNGIIAVYREYRLLLSTWALKQHMKSTNGSLSSPHDIANLIGQVYDSPFEELGFPEEWMSVVDKAKEKEKEFRTQQRLRASNALLPSPASNIVSNWSVVMTQADENDTSQVRDIDESIEVILVQQIGGRVYPLHDAGEDFADFEVDGDFALDYPIARHLARCSVRMPGYLLRDEDIEELEAEGSFGGWHNTPILKHQLPLILDENLQKTLSQVQVTYDQEEGLLVTRVH